MNKYILYFLFTSFKLFSFSNTQHLLVRYRNGASPQAFAQNARQFKNVNQLWLLELASPMSIESVMKNLQSNPNVEYVERDQEIHATESTNDPLLDTQWALHQAGIDIDDGWKFASGNSDIIIGVIDTGVDYHHPDLIKNLWKNPHEIADNQIDDDHNGYVDDVYGVNMIEKNGDPLDDNGHGSHVTGILAAVGNNNIGISGVMQNAQIISCKFLDKNGAGLLSDAISCLEYFSNSHIPIVATNNSWGGNNYSQALYDAIFEQSKNGTLFIVAAGNASIDHDETALYPASYNLTNLISVAAIDSSGDLADFSDYGHYSIHVAAPGVDILSTKNGKYEKMSGTSMATPHVTGLAGLIKSQDTRRDWKAIRNLILTGGKTLPALKDSILTGKLINPPSTLSCLNQLFTTHVLPHGNSISVELGQTIPLSTYNLNCEKSLGNRSISINMQNQTLVDDGSGLMASSFKPPSVGLYTIDFGQDDKASIDVYDSTQWKAYQAPSTPLFYYRSFTGKPIPTGDETKATLTSPFSIPFSGPNSGIFQIYVSSNGALSVTDNRLSGFHNTGLPVSDHTSLIAPFWVDLKPEGNNSGIFYDILGTAPNRELIVEWRNMQEYNSTLQPLTFQIVFFEDKSDILFNYLHIDEKASPTIGIQVKPKLLLQYHGTIKNGSSLLFQL